MSFFLSIKNNEFKFFNSIRLITILNQQKLGMVYSYRCNSWKKNQFSAILGKKQLWIYYFRIISLLSWKIAELGINWLKSSALKLSRYKAVEASQKKVELNMIQLWLVRRKPWNDWIYRKKRFCNSFLENLINLTSNHTSDTAFR